MKKKNKVKKKIGSNFVPGKKFFNCPNNFGSNGNPNVGVASEVAFAEIFETSFLGNSELIPILVPEMNFS